MSKIEHAPGFASSVLCWFICPFSFWGRMNRSKYWLFFSVLFVLGLLFFGLAFGSLFEWLERTKYAADHGYPSVRVMEKVILWILFFPIIICAAAVSARRLHDRNKSAWWLLFGLIPFILIGASDGLSVFISNGIVLLAIVQLGMLRGTIGPNRYGPDPIEGFVGS